MPGCRPCQGSGTRRPDLVLEPALRFGRDDDLPAAVDLVAREVAHALPDPALAGVRDVEDRERT
jgi:hypothetical protein